jgi:urease accessory protein
MPHCSNLHLAFEADHARGTILRVREQQPPWRVIRGFPNASGETLAHVHNLSGGILDTDSLSWQVDAGPRAQAQVTSTGATRVYRSRSPDRRASQRVRASVASEAYLEYLPDQLIPFAGSRFDQSARVEIARGGSLIWWDRVAPGREASDEIFRFESLTSNFELIADGQPVALERWSLEPLAQRLNSLARLGPFRHFASCYVCRPGEPPSFWKSFESEMQTAADRISSSGMLWGATSLRAHGVTIRGLAVNGRSLAAGLLEIWKNAKWLLVGRAATLPRKVY